MKKCWRSCRTAVLAVTAAVAVTGLMGCSGADSGNGKDAGSAAVSVPTEPFGDTVKYDPAQPVNEGKGISVEFWEWGSDNLFQELIDGYTAIHPNVSIKLVNNP